MSYKDTLLMPKTEFEMKGKLPIKEPLILKRWEDLDFYQLHLQERAGKKQFILHDGPPYANGNIHIGHGLNKVLKDFVNRSKSMQGYLTPFIPGWDTHGLPIEVAITKTGVNRKEMSISEFRLLCENYAYEQIEIQKAGFKRLGSFGDYNNPYVTLQKSYEEAQIRIFAKMALDGIIYQGFKPVYWSPSSETALAEGELEYYDREDLSIYLKFNVEDGKGLLDKDCAFVCWTTMPWTLAGVVGVALGKDITYGLYQTSKGKLIVAEELAQSAFEHIGVDYELIKKFQGKELEYLTTINPLTGYECLVVLGDHVSVDGGTGCVTTAPGHGSEDFICGQEYDLELIVGCDIYGKMKADFGADLAGLYWEKANKVIIEKLSAEKTIIGSFLLNHSYPFDWRTKKPIIFMAALQWFASIDKERANILAEIEKVNWKPSWGQTRMHNMIKDRNDWCISRQRVWGVPIPIIFDENKQPIIEQEVFEFIADKIGEHGSNIWFESEVSDLLPESFKLNHPEYVNYTKETDIMDVWFDSGSSHTSCVIERGLTYPVDLYLEGSDQYRGWFNSSLIIGTTYHGQSPYKQVVSHGFALDSKGNKMSKSLGNVVEPQKIMEQYGADIFRYWVASVEYQSDVKIGDDVLKQVADAYRKVRNTFKFILGNLNNFDASKVLSYDELSEVDQYLLIKLNKLNEECIADYNNYDFSNVYSKVNSFISKELSAFYMDFTKDILYILKEDDLRRVQVQSALYQCLETLTYLLAPFLAFTMEEVYDFIPKDNKKLSVHLEEFIPAKEYKNSAVVENKFDLFMNFRDDVLKALEVARENKVIGKPLEAQLMINLKEEYQFIKDIPNVAQLCIVSNIIFNDEKQDLDLETASISVAKYDGYTCPRCWNVVANDRVIDDLCDRCYHVLND